MIKLLQHCLCLKTFVAMFVLLATNSSIQAYEPSDTGWQLHLDNDAFSLPNEDRDYTQGFAFTQSGARVLDYHLSLLPLIDVIDGWAIDRILHRPATDQRHSFQIGMQMYTPENIERRRPIRDDHPFASLFYIANGRQRLHPEANRVDYSGMILGFLGTPVGRETQEMFHDIINGDKPSGWRHQISDGGEPTFLYYLARQQRLLESAALGDGYDAKLTANASLGYITELGIALSGRWGNRTSLWWSDTSDLYVYQALPTAPPAGVEQAGQWHVFGGLAARLRLYNAFLQGQFRESEVTFSSSELKPVVGEAWLGLHYRINREFGLRYSIRAQTDPFRGARGYAPVWGSIEIQKLI